MSAHPYNGQLHLVTEELSDTMNSTSRNAQDKKTLKLQFLEGENRNLAQIVEDLQTTLSINKNIIKGLLDQKRGTSGQLEYAISQMTQENEMLESAQKRVTEERD